jgi:hypothetical protein
MPQTNQPTQEENDAYRLLFDQIHAPVFFEKLAEHGIEPSSPEEIEALLQMGATLMQSQAVARQKQASAQGSFILQAARSLDVALADRGLAPAQSSALDGVIKSAAYKVAQDKTIRDAVITYQNYIARQHQQAG